MVSTETDNSIFSAEFKNNINITASNADNLIRQIRYIKQGRIQKTTYNILKQNGGSSDRIYKFTNQIPCYLSIDENTLDGNIIGLDTHNNAVIESNNNTHSIKLHNNLKINNNNIYGGTVLSITSTEQQLSPTYSSTQSSNRTSVNSSSKQSSNRTSVNSSSRQTSNRTSVNSSSEQSSNRTSVNSSSRQTSENSPNIFSISEISSVNVSSNKSTSHYMNTSQLTETDIQNNTSFNSSITEIKSSDKSIHGMRGGNNVSTRAGFLNMDSNSVNSYFSESSSAAESGLCD
jgi:hypothetical protein